MNILPLFRAAIPALIWAAALGAAAARPAAAQSTAGRQPTVGLALSGGNAKAVSHVGVLRVLEEAGVPLDVIAGTSMGAILGSLYAIGYTPDMLERFVLAEDWDRLLSDTPSRRNPTVRRTRDVPLPVTVPLRRGRPQLPSSLASGQRFSQMLARVLWPVQTTRDFRSLPVPFAAVATDLETGDAVMLDSGFLPDVVRASAAIPSVFAPVRIDGRVLVDGALARNLPAPDARALGADVVICSDVSDPLEPADSLLTFLDVLNQAISFRMNESNQAQRERCDILITPDITGLRPSSFDRADEWIARGEAAARAVMADLEGVARLAGRPPRRLPVMRLDSVYVDSIGAEGLTDTQRRLALRLLRLRRGSWLTATRVDDAVSRLHATGLFPAVRSRLDEQVPRDPARAMLILSLDEGERDVLGFGLRYESRYKGSAVFGATLYDALLYGSTAQFDVRIGEQARLAADFTRRGGPQDQFTLGIGGSFIRAPFDTYVDGEREGETRVNRLNLSLSGGIDIGKSAVIGAEVKGEYARGTAVANDPALPRRRTFYTVAGVVRVNSYDRDFFPDRGLSVVAKSVWADRSIGSNATFAQYIFRAAAHVPVRPRWTVFGAVAVGASTGPDLPSHYHFYLGGSHEYHLFLDRHVAFVGLEPQERRGRHLQMGLLGIQYQLVEDVFALVRWNTGTTLNDWRVRLDDYINGFGATIGLRTVVGQVRFTLAGREFTSWPDVEVDVGYGF